MFRIKKNKKRETPRIRLHFKEIEIMAHARSAVHPHDVPATKISAPSASTRPRFFRRLVAALVESRQRQADREIAMYLHSVGGKFTDDAEREIERRFLSSPR
jgi:hypothetical protein